MLSHFTFANFDTVRVRHRTEVTPRESSASVLLVPSAVTLSTRFFPDALGVLAERLILGRLGNDQHAIRVTDVGDFRLH